MGKKQNTFNLWDLSRTMFASQRPMDYQPKRFVTTFTGKTLDKVDSSNIKKENNKPKSPEQ
jgi:hypothetical protein